MSRSALSVFVYGLYALGAGAGFLFIPSDRGTRTTLLVELRLSKYPDRFLAGL